MEADYGPFNFLITNHLPFDANKGQLPVYTVQNG